jgi:hypothetical protein
MTIQELTIEEKRKIMYTYWNDLPFTKHADSSNYYLLEQSEVKSFIIKYIRDGIEDEFGKLQGLSRRHAFTVKELHEAYKTISNKQKYSISNFHFHLKQLEKLGYIKNVAKILEGRQYQNYYGRTAINFLPVYDYHLSTEMNQNVFGPLKDLIKKMNPDIEISYINQIFDENLKFMEDYYYRIFSWMKDKYPQLYESKLDLRVFMDMVGHYSLFHTKFSDNLRRIGSLIGLDQLMNYNRHRIEE